MGLFGKIKDILFEEEEVVETSEPKKEVREEVKVKEEPRIEIKEVVKPVEPKIERSYEEKKPVQEEFLGERDFLTKEKESYEEYFYNGNK